MRDYYFLLDEKWFETRCRPSLSEAWRRRTFACCQELCQELLPAAAAFRQRYHLGAQPLLVTQVAEGLPFAREFWRDLVNEVLFLSAALLPELAPCFETLCHLLEPSLLLDPLPTRSTFHPLQQVHFGARDLTFGAAVYRPEAAGYNRHQDVLHLCDYLEALNPERWDPASLTFLDSDEDRAEEVAYAQEGLRQMQQMYGRAAQRGEIIVWERIEA